MANKYTITVEAKDRGEVVKLSSTATVILNIIDGNNHPPVITGQTVSDNVLKILKNNNHLCCSAFFNESFKKVKLVKNLVCCYQIGFRLGLQSGLYGFCGSD